MKNKWIYLTLIMLIISSNLVLASQTLETETARFLPAEQGAIESAFEYQTSADGKELSLPIAIEYGLTDRLNLLVEPLFFTSIIPKVDKSATGIGDLESTLECLVLNEKGACPAIALATEVKIPTAKNALIGTGKTNFTGYVILSKHFGQFDSHGNLGYSIMGKPAGVSSLNNILAFALAQEFHVSPQFDFVGEFLGNTSSEATGGTFSGSENSASPEFAGGELVGMLGGCYLLNHNIILSLGLCYDNNQAQLLRPGLNMGF